MSLRKRPWASVLVLGLLTSVPVLASVSSSARQTANEFASRSVSRVGCADFEQYFNQVLAPRLQALRESKEADREYLQNLIWHYSKKRYKKFNQKYEVSSKALMSVVSSYLESGTVSSEALSQVSGVAKRYGIACGCSDALAASEASEKAVEVLNQVNSINRGLNQEVHPQETECRPDAGPSPSEMGFGETQTEGSAEKVDRLVDIAYQGTLVWRNRKRQIIMKDDKPVEKSASTSSKKCGMYVSIALEDAGCRSKDGPDFRESNAKDLGKDLAANGFKNLMSEKGILPNGMTTLKDVPPGSVLIYDGGLSGHAEIKSRNGFISDYYSQNARTGEKAPPEGRGRRIIGIWVKPSCGAGYEKL